jgi:hypothetical protein
MLLLFSFFPLPDKEILYTVLHCSCLARSEHSTLNQLALYTEYDKYEICRESQE